MKHEESYIQEVVVAVLARQYKDLLRTGGFAGEKLTIGQAVRRKRMGYVSGSPDLIIFSARGKYHGLFVELKTKTGQQSPAQKDWQRMADKAGYCYKVCRSSSEAVTTISSYLSQGEYNNGN